jgi:hypothetical protein
MFYVDTLEANVAVSKIPLTCLPQHYCASTFSPKPPLGA